MGGVGNGARRECASSAVLYVSVCVKSITKSFFDVESRSGTTGRVRQFVLTTGLGS